MYGETDNSQNPVKLTKLVIQYVHPLKKAFNDQIISLACLWMLVGKIQRSKFSVKQKGMLNKDRLTPTITGPNRAKTGLARSGFPESVHVLAGIDLLVHRFCRTLRPLAGVLKILSK